jgi:hypothetical protein
VFSVGDGGLNHLLDDARSFFLREIQDVERLIHFFTADQISDQTAFVDRQTNAPEGCTCFHGLSLLSHNFFISRVTFESPGECELAQLMANHLIGDVNRDVLLAVVHSDGQADELGQDHGATRPSFDRLFVFIGDGLVGLSYQMMVDKGTFFE